MKKTITLTFAGIVAVGAMSFEILNGDGKAGKTGSPGEGNCTVCHSGTDLNAGPGSVSISSTPSLANGYTAGNTYTVDVTVAESVAPNNAEFGFGFEALFASGANGGTFAITNSTLTTIKTATVTANVRDNVVQTGTGNVGPNSQIFSFNWTAPATGSGLVTFYTTGLASNNNAATSGDHTYRDTLLVPENTNGITESAFSNINFSVFPNPFSETTVLRITNTRITNYELNIYNVFGQKIYNEIICNSPFVISSGIIIRRGDLLQGVYFIQIKDEKVSSLKKIIIE